MELHLRISGCLLIGLALLHVVFPVYFDWATDLRPLRLINRQLMYVHTLFIALTVLLMGLLCVRHAADLAHTALGHTVALGLGVFWLARLTVQFVGYSAELWRGKRFETAIHVVFSVLWAYLTVVFFTTGWLAS